MRILLMKSHFNFGSCLVMPGSNLQISKWSTSLSILKRQKKNQRINKNLHPYIYYPYSCYEPQNQNNGANQKKRQSSSIMQKNKTKTRTNTLVRSDEEVDTSIKICGHKFNYICTCIPGQQLRRGEMIARKGQFSENNIPDQENP